MYENFKYESVEIDNLSLSVHQSAISTDLDAGPPILLLHGYPQTSYIWRFIAPELAKTNRLIIVDLPGYGKSQGPEPDAKNYNYSKRNMANILVNLMSKLGYPKFAVLSHDRGARIGFRMCLDHPETVTKYAALDIVPTLSVWDKMNWTSAMGTFHWPFLAQPAPMPENVIKANPVEFFERLLNDWAGKNTKLSKDAIDHYTQVFSAPSVISASCADYRAGATTDVEHDRIDQKNGAKITCPVLVMYGDGYLKDLANEAKKQWQPWTTDLTEVALSCGHFIVEEVPEQSIPPLLKFFK
jgi:haloacetate dehalogenase